MPALLCPACKHPLVRADRTWACEKLHTFDIAREGYVNLLLAHQKHSRTPGDNPLMVQARRDFLQTGAYQPLIAAAVDLIAPLNAATLLDVGCGEGAYTAAFAPVVPDITGLDISKPAVQLAARRHRGITWIVGNAAMLPVADASVDLLASLFSHCVVAEAARVLAPGGHVLLATPAPDHLMEIRQRLYDEVRPHEPDKLIAGFTPGFELVQRREVRFPLHLAQQSLKNLLMMTPYAWKAKLERRTALEEGGAVDTTAAFVLFLLKVLPADTPSP